MIKVMVSDFTDLDLVYGGWDEPPKAFARFVVARSLQEAVLFYAPASKVNREGIYQPYTDVEIIKSIEQELEKLGYEIIPNEDAPVFASLTPEQSTIATKSSFEVREKN